MKVDITYKPEPKKAKKSFTIGDLAVGEIGMVSYVDFEETGEKSYYLRVSKQDIIDLEELLSGPIAKNVWREECVKLESGSLAIEITL